MNVEKLLKDLNITEKGSYDKNGNYVIDIDSSNKFGRVYSKLENNDYLDQNEATTNITEHNGNITYKYDDQARLTLIADWDNDTYKLVIEEL